MDYKFQFVGMGRQPIRYALHPANCCPNPLDSELQFKFQFIALLESTQPATKLPCHCEEAFMADVAISIKTRRYHVAYRTILRRKRRT